MYGPDASRGICSPDGGQCHFVCAYYENYIWCDYLCVVWAGGSSSVMRSSSSSMRRRYISSTSSTSERVSPLGGRGCSERSIGTPCSNCDVIPPGTGSGSTKRASLRHCGRIDSERLRNIVASVKTHVSRGHSCCEAARLACAPPAQPAHGLREMACPAYHLAGYGCVSSQLFVLIIDGGLRRLFLIYELSSSQWRYSGTATPQTTPLLSNYDTHPSVKGTPALFNQFTRPINQLKVRHLRVVSVAPTRPHNSGVSARPGGIALPGAKR
eukprot:COSAG01_NODE_3129_length_6538_cov_5.398354_4_plen_269_part_00